MKSLFYITVCIVLLVSCGNKKTETPDDTPTSGVIAIASDGCFAPVVEEEIAVFESIYKEAGIVPYFSGETETINRLLRDSIRLAITSRPLTKEETEFMNTKKLFPRNIQIATDAIALIVKSLRSKSSFRLLVNVTSLGCLLSVYSPSIRYVVTSYPSLPNTTVTVPCSIPVSNVLSNKDFISPGIADVVMSQSPGVLFKSESLTHPPTAYAS